MKKTFPANIDGQIFYIDEDAFNLLNNYLEQLRMTFRGDESEEIVGDIESRVRELLSNRMDGGKCVIVLADVNNVIETLGRPEDISDGQPEPECQPDSNTGENEQQTECKAENANAENGDKKAFIQFNFPTRKKLFRSNDNKVFGGVFGGLGYFLGWNANIMRLFYVIIALFTKVWPLTIIYLICWMIIPLARTPKQIIEMRGKPLNLNSVGQAVMETTVVPPPYNDDSNNFFATVFSIIGKSLMAILGGVCALFGIGCLLGIIGLIIGLTAYHLGTLPPGLEDVPWHEVIASHNIIAIVTSLLMVLTLSFGFAWGAFAVVTNTKGPKPVFAWAMLIIFIIFLVTFLLTTINI